MGQKILEIRKLNACGNLGKYLLEARDKHSPPHIFRQALKQITSILGRFATSLITFSEKEVQTPLGPACELEADEKVAIIPVLRAGMIMQDPMLEIFPDALVWHIGMERDANPNNPPIVYLNKIPTLLEQPPIALVLDPMLATAGSLVKTCSMLQEAGIERMVSISIFAAPEGIEEMEKRFPEMALVTAAIDRNLNERAYIVPGCGDAGDRCYPTK